tara:strand:+ start:580 stop:1293 length:714 start_codon:yes stop_codon:yes gene_type:complete
MKFKFNLLPLIVTTLLICLGMALGNWQSEKAQKKILLKKIFEEKKMLPPILINATNIDSAFEEFRTVRILGQFITSWPIYLDNRPLDGKPGFYLIMPFKVLNSDTYILVSRGWFQRNFNDRNLMPEINVPKGIFKLEGRLKSSLGKVFQFGKQPDLKPGAVLQNLNINEFRKVSHYNVHTFFIEQTNFFDDSLIREWPSPSFGIDMHKGYAFQWYALVLLTFLFFLFTRFKNGSEKN